MKGYGYNTQKRRDWEMIPVVQFVAQGSWQVADLGDGVTKQAEAVENDDRTDLHLLHCQKVSEHPAVPDLICSPELGADNGPWFRISRTT